MVQPSDAQQGTTVGKEEEVVQISPQPSTSPATQPNTYPYGPFWSVACLATTAFAIFIVWTVPWLYVGATWKPLDKIRQSRIWVLNCDALPDSSSLSPALAPYLSAAFATPLGYSWVQSSVLNSSSSTSVYNVFTPFVCPNVPENSTRTCGTPAQELECTEYLNHLLKDDQKGWGALYFPSNFTTTVVSFIYGSGITPHGQEVQMQYRYASGRDYPNVRFTSSVLMEAILPSINQGVTASLAQLASSFTVDPLLFARGINILRYDLSPVRFFGQHFASFFFCISMWLASTFLAGVNNNFKTPAEAAYVDITIVNKPGKKQLLKELLLKLALALFFLFMLAVLLVCIIWSLGRGKAPFHRSGGQAMAVTWYLGWSFYGINWFLISALGPEKFSSLGAFILVLQLTTGNAIFHDIMSTKFFRIGRMFPFYYGTRALRTIFFGVMEHKWWVNWLVLTAWNVGTITMAILLAIHKTVKNSEMLAMRFAGQKVPPQLTIL